VSPELENLCTVLRDAAQAEIMPRFRNVSSQAKADGSLVTAADLGAQQRIMESLKRLRPEIPLLGEEMTAWEQASLLEDADTGVWCLDPLDGTSNYACGYPYFGVSLALLKGGEPVLGTIYDPVRNECFCAERGAGAWIDGESLRSVSDRQELGDCLALVDLKRLPPQDLSRMGGDAPFRSQRNLGSVALDWCWLAAGRGQLYLHGGQKLWDYSAGRLIATEAAVPSCLFRRGGFEAPSGLSLEPRMAVAAANRALFERWVSWLELPRPAPAD
jgi:myo-inositol-1(or 4)-monophosphatase